MHIVCFVCCFFIYYFNCISFAIRLSGRRLLLNWLVDWLVRKSPSSAHPTSNFVFPRVEYLPPPRRLCFVDVCLFANMVTQKLLERFSKVRWKGGTWTREETVGGNPNYITLELGLEICDTEYVSPDVSLTATIYSGSSALAEVALL